ncbi:MAG: HD domain-containing response regulator [Peptococcaceae bacterium]|nr:HD domain-containing response regulator [Peptococcaceae bacterium]
MRKNKIVNQQRDFTILALDDDPIMTVTLQSYFQTSGYKVDIENDPEIAIERVRSQRYDILLLDFLMSPICGDEVVSRIRKFDRDVYIILLTGHKSLAPPIKTIRELDIQGYYEKSDRFDQLELLVESCVKSIRQMRVIHEYRDRLKRMVEKLPEVYRMQPLDSLMEEILEFMSQVLSLDAGYLYLDANSLNSRLSAGAAAGFRLPEYYLGTGKYKTRPDKARELFDRLRESTEDTQNYLLCRGQLALPLMDADNQIFGMISMEASAATEVEIRQLFEIYAKQAAASISNVLLHTLLNQKNQELTRTYGSLKDSYLDIISALRLVVDTKDIYTRGHSDRVSYYALKLAEAMGKDAAFLERVRVAGLFHDVGKINIPDYILLKSTELTAEEFNEVKKHPVKGKEILAAITMFSEIAPIVEQHHERFDGRGYPRGLKGPEILEEARLISIADAFDAMTSHRRYRSNMTLEQAVDQLQKGKGSQFDAAAVDIFLKILETGYDDMRRELDWTFHKDE